MSYAEAQEWADYIDRHGGLDLGQRMEQGFALLAVLLAQLGGRKNAKFEDYLPKRAAKADGIDDALAELFKGRS